MTARVLSTAHGTHREAFAPIDWALFLTLGTVWGSSFVLMAVGLESFRPGLVTWLRIVFGAAALWSLRRARVRIDRQDLPRLLVTSITWVVLPFWLFPLAQGSVNSAIAGMLNGAVPIFTAILASALLRRPPGLRQLVGIPVGFVGVTAIATSAAAAGSSQLVGVVEVLVACFCYAIAFNVSTPLQQKYGSLPVVAAILAIATVLTAPLGIASLPGSSFAWDAIAAMAVLGLVGTGFAFVLMGRLVGRVGATRASIVGYLIPVVALVLGVLLRGDEVGPFALAGVVLVVVGAYLASRREVAA